MNPRPIFAKYDRFEALAVRVSEAVVDEYDRGLALHEGAHVVISYRTDASRVPGDSIVKIRSFGKGGYATLLKPPDEKGPLIYLAGGIAAQLYGSGCCGVSAPDVQMALDCLKAVGAGRTKLQADISNLIKLLMEPGVKAAVNRVADALQSERLLFGTEVEKLLAPWLPEWRLLNKRFPRIVKAGDGAHDVGPRLHKSYEVILDGKRVIDYKDVKIRGYLSTFKHVTESDREGDYVEPGAFKDTISQFMRNPVLLADHLNKVENLAGRFTKVVEDARGLFVEAELSNSPTPFLKHIRALVAEGHLKTLSMSGRFEYKSDGRGIVKVELLEGSLTPIPANPDALFSVIS